ncbi:MAG: Crp/Fnr family transcriptional regulator [Burkholderiaceae bacterium]
MVISLLQARTCQSQLLSRLPDDQYELILPMLDMVQTTLKEVLYRQGESIEYVYFPCNCGHSSMVYMEDGTMIEVGTVGNETFTGVELLFDAKVAIETVICQIPGFSMRMKVEDFRHAVDDQPAFRKLLQRSAQAYLAQVAQSAACNRLHSVDMRFARWLLISHDRVQSNEFALTQEFIASMLGVHRPSVSLVAGAFQQAGIIKYSRGRISILDRASLEDASCECYSTVRKQFKRLLDIAHG